MTDNNKDIELLAPENFACVESGVYRSSFPRSKNMEFLKKLGLRTVISLVPEDYPKGMKDFYDANGISLKAYGLDGNKWPFKAIDVLKLHLVLHTILQPESRPLLIHCNKGKHRTGSVVGCLRKQRQWAMCAIFEEYLLYASPKTRLEDQMLIESFLYDPATGENMATTWEQEEMERKLAEKENKKNKKKNEDDDEDAEDDEQASKKEKKKDKEKDKDKEKSKEKKKDKEKVKEEVVDETTALTASVETLLPSS